MKSIDWDRDLEDAKILHKKLLAEEEERRRLGLPVDDELTVDMEAEWEAEWQRMQEDADLEVEIFRSTH